MRQWFKALLFSTSIASFAPVTTPAFAQATAPSGGAAALAVDGVKLGMTPAETIAALKAFDPTIVITDNTGDPKDHLGTTFWDSAFVITAISADYAAVAKIQKTLENESAGVCISNAAKAGMLPSDQLDKCNTEEQKADQDYDSKLRTIVNNPRFVQVWFSPVPGNVKAIAVSSSTVFIKTVPTVANVIQALHKKYPDPKSGETSDIDQDYFAIANDEDYYSTAKVNTTFWYYDPKGRIRSLESAARIGWTTIKAYSTDNAELSLLNPKINENAPTAVMASDGLVNTPPNPDIVLPTSVNEGNGIQLIAHVIGGASVDGDEAWLGEAKVDPATGNLEPQAVNNPLLATILDISLFDSKGVYKYQQEASTYLQNVQNQQNQGNASSFQKNSPNL